MFPVLGGEVVEGEQRVAIFRQALDGLLILDAVGFDERIDAVSAAFLVSAIQMSCNARLALACRLFGSLFRTFAVLCTQQRCARVFGHTSSIAFQKPSAPSATASCGSIVRPRRLRSISSSFQDWALSRMPSASPI